LLFVEALVSARAADIVFNEGYGDDRPQLRQWLWRRWTHHRDGTALVKWITVEGESGTTEYTVAKGSSGAWYLSIHRQAWRRPTRDSDSAQWEDSWLIAHSLSRTKEPYHDDWAGTPIQYSRPLPARKFVLELKDQEGKILGHI